MADGIKGFFNTPDITSQFTQEDINSTKGLAWLSYGGPLFLIPMFVKKDSKYTRFHVNQGIILCIFYVAVFIVTLLLGLIKTPDPFWGTALMRTPWWVNLINFILWIPVGVFAVFGIINAVKGFAKELPLIGKFRILK